MTTINAWHAGDLRFGNFDAIFFASDRDEAAQHGEPKLYSLRLANPLRVASDCVIGNPEREQQLIQSAIDAGHDSIVLFDRPNGTHFYLVMDATCIAT